VSRGQGLSNLILGDVSGEDVVKTTDIANLYFLPCGPTPPNPAELLMTDRFKDALKQLQSRFDRILLDSPPILAVTDALVLAKHADGVILVMKAGSTTRDDVRRSARHLKGVDARVVGAILNELDIENRAYGYYSHYYAYGYGNESKAAGKA
jgi:capsular exopolysaccharide synthesis family protein